MIKQKEQADKRLLSLEWFIGIAATAILLILVFVASFVQMEAWLRGGLIVVGVLLFLAGCFYAVRIEQVAGYYVCKKCGHRYVPTYQAVSLAPHMGRTRYMRCPSCGQKSWQKKVIRRESY